MLNLIELAKANFNALRNNPYPGRGIVVGIDQTGKFLIQICWMMGRRERTQNRVYVVDDLLGGLRTAVADPSLTEGDTSLIIYPAMAETTTERGSHYVVSNGAQTDKALAYANSAYSLGDILVMEGGGWPAYSYEPDPPNYTPRITALCTRFLREKRLRLQMSILRRSPFEGERCDRDDYDFREFSSGYGYCITTYSGDGDPLPSFDQRPLLMPIASADQLAVLVHEWWDTLDPNNRVALAIKRIPLDGGVSDIGVFNRRQLVAA